MADAVGIAIHHEERVLAPGDHEMRGVVARPRRLGKEIRVRRFLLEILDPPRAPERLDLRLWELHQVLQVGRETTNRSGKVERLFAAAGQLGQRRPDQEEIAFAVTARRLRSQQFFRLAVQAREQLLELVVGNDERVELATVPLGRAFLRLEEFRTPDIQEYPFIFTTARPKTANASRSSRLAREIFRAVYPLVKTTARMTATAQKRSTIALLLSCSRRAATAAASSKQSGGRIGKIRSIRFDGTNDMMTKPPKLHARSQKVSGESLAGPPLFFFRATK